MKLRILVLSPGPSNCRADSPQWSWAVRELGAEIGYYRDHSADFDALCRGADVVAYMAVMGGPDLPQIAALKRARQHCRLVAIFGDGGCPMCLPLQERYRDEDVFDSMVNIDGRFDWPHTPGRDFNYWGMFDPKPWEKPRRRGRRLGYNGAGGIHREPLVRALGKDIDAVVGYDPCRPYQEYVEWMLQTRAVVNTSWTSYAWRKNSKGRVNEAALAGCLLFETFGSSTASWFTVGEEYLEYGDHTGLQYHHKVSVGGEAPSRDEKVAASMPKVAEDIRAVLRRPDFDEYAEAMGARMKARLLRDYGPEKFWRKVCDSNIGSRTEAAST